MGIGASNYPQKIKTMNENIFSSGMLLKGSTKTGADLSTTSERLCNTCRNYKGKLNCRLIDKIKNPDHPYCSWWKERLDKKMETKICSDCKEIKTIDKFYKYKSSPDGHQSKCIDCAIRYERERQGNNYENKTNSKSM